MSDFCECSECVEARQWIVDKTGVGGGSNPLSFLIASHDTMAAEREDMRRQVVEVRCQLFDARAALARIRDSLRTFSEAEVYVGASVYAGQILLMQQTVESVLGTNRGKTARPLGAKRPPEIPPEYDDQARMNQERKTASEAVETAAHELREQALRVSGKWVPILRELSVGTLIELGLLDLADDLRALGASR